MKKGFTYRELREIFWRVGFEYANIDSFLTDKEYTYADAFNEFIGRNPRDKVIFGYDEITQILDWKVNNREKVSDYIKPIKHETEIVQSVS